MSIVIVAGPPCSGKTTYAERLGLTVLDWDALFAEFTGRPLWEQPFHEGSRVEREFRRRAALMSHGAIIRCAPRKQNRAIMRRIHSARSVVLAVPALECLRRLEESDRPEEAQARARVVIRRWWAEYEPSDKDLVLV